MQEEDLEIIRNEANASPQRYEDWDPAERFRHEYYRRHPDEHPTHGTEAAEEAVETPPITRHQTTASSSSSSSFSSTDDNARLEEVRTAHSSHTEAAARRTATGTNSAGLARVDTNGHPIALSRIQTARSQHLQTVGTRQTTAGRQPTRTSTRYSKPLPEFGGGKPYPPSLPAREEYVVEFDGIDDPLHAQNWPLNTKLYLGAILAFDALAATMGSSIFSPGIGAVAKEFGVIQEVGTLGTTLFVFGYAFGPLLWAPFSELYGRRPPIVIAAFGFSIFSIAVAVGKDLQTIMISRFFAGLFGSCPLAVVAAIFADMFSNKVRGLAVAVFSACVFCGPLFAPFIGGFITTSHLGWRWTEYISAIMGFTAFGLVAIFLKETYPPVVLVSKASELRRRTKNWGIHAKQEEVEVDFQELLVRNVSRPMRILFTEPIVLLVTIYMSFIYGLLYLFLTAYALVFQGVYGWSSGISGLAYFGMVLGEAIGFIVIVMQNPGYVKRLEANHNVPVPEWRLPTAMVGGVVFAAGLFWFGWTGYTGTVPWIVPVLSGLFTGFGIFTIFLCLLNYIIDAYLMFAASAIAANTFMRSLFGGVFPLFATYMFEGMGIQWAATLLGCVALIFVPAPIIFYIFGKKIRAKSKFAPAPDIQLDKKRDEEARAGGDGESSDMQTPVAHPQREAEEKEKVNGQSSSGSEGAKVKEKEG